MNTNNNQTSAPAKGGKGKGNQTTDTTGNERRLTTPMRFAQPIHLPTPRGAIRHTQSGLYGFTLVEIMIVVAIIGLLAAIAIPNFVKARDEGRKGTCINNLRQIDAAMQQWALANNKTAADAAPTANDVLPYLKHKVVCPAGGSTFADSYAMLSITNPPTCVSSGGGSASGHVMPPDTTN